VQVQVRKDKEGNRRKSAPARQKKSIYARALSFCIFVLFLVLLCPRFSALSKGSSKTHTKK
jgi:hypothetical protein